MFWKRKTDEEYIESQRKWLLRSRRVAAGAFVAAICMGAVYLALLDRLMEALIGKDNVGIEFAKGMLIGILIAKMFLVVGGLIGASMVWFWKPRVLRLLVAYHDRLQEMEKRPGSAGDLPKGD